MVRLNTRLDPTQTGHEASKLYTALQKQVVGQGEAIDQIVSVYQMFLAGMNQPGRPTGNFLFLGPTGSGKTRMVEATAEFLAGDARAMVKIDCAEFQHSHEIAKLIGSPPGYLGHRETHPVLSQEALDRHRSGTAGLSFVLFDEVEKASDALWNLLLGILDKATLTLGDNRRVDFSRALIFMTSNLGAAEMDAIRRPRFGFAASELEKLYDRSDGDGESSARISEAGLDAARRRFNPEFLNRLDKIVVFNPLGEVELRAILEIELRRLQRQILNSSPAAPFAIALTEAAKSHLLQEGTNARYGARHLKRAIDCSLVRPLSNLIATRQVREGDWITVDFDEHACQMVFTKEGEDLPTYVMAQLSEAPGTVPAGLADAAGAESPASAARGNRKGTPVRGRNVAA